MPGADRSTMAELRQRLRRTLPGRARAAAPAPEGRPAAADEDAGTARFEVGPHSFVVSTASRDDSYVAHIADAPLPAAVWVAGAVAAPDAVVFDVGANIGLTAAAFATFAPDGAVHAFEPGDRAYGDLQATIRANGFGNVTAHHVAVGREDGTAQLLVPNWNASGAFMAGESSASALHAGNDAVTVTDVDVRSLDSLVAELGVDRLDLLKIDVEGHEDAVLDGAAGTLERFHPVCVIEFNVFTLSVFVGRNPLEFLVDTMARFPHVVAVDGALRTGPVVDVPSAYDITHRCFVNSHVIDLVCSWEPLDEQLAFAAAEGRVAD